LLRKGYTFIIEVMLSHVLVQQKLSIISNWFYQRKKAYLFKY